MKEGISIIIPNLNGEKVLGFCLQSLVNQSLEKTKYEIIVIDNNSNDNSKDICRSFEQKNPNINIQCIRLSKNVGYGNAINIGAKRAKYQYILATNNDIIFHPYYLEILLSTIHSARKIDSRIAGAVGLHFYYPEVNCINSAGGILSLVGGHYRYYNICIDIKDYIKFIKNYVLNRRKIWNYTGFGTGAALLIDRRIFTKLGGFHRLYFAGVEEFDLGLLLNLAGYKMIFVPSAVLYHRESFTLGRRGIFDANKIRYYLYGNFFYVLTLIQGIDKVLGLFALIAFSLIIILRSLFTIDQLLVRSIIDVYKFLYSTIFRNAVYQRRAVLRWISLFRYEYVKKILRSYSAWWSLTDIIRKELSGK
jgi:GT2 family glycosyltransferase